MLSGKSHRTIAIEAVCLRYASGIVFAGGERAKIYLCAAVSVRESAGAYAAVLACLAHA